MRFGSAKPLARLGRRPILEWALASAREFSTGVVLVLPYEAIRDHSLGGHPLSGPAEVPGSKGSGPQSASGVLLPPWTDLSLDGLVDVVTAGASTRAGSVRSGLVAVPESAEVIVVHDAARPLARKALFASVIAAVREGADGAVPGIDVVDTLKRLAPAPVKPETGEPSERRDVLATLERSGVVGVQTPQAFQAQALRAAHGGHEEASDDASLVESNGGRVVVVPGDRRNLKVTYPADLAIAEALAEGWDW